MRFLILTQYFPPEVGAAQTRLGSITRELIRLGHEVEVVTALPNHGSGRIAKEYRGKLAVTEMWEGARVRRIWLYASTGAGVKRLVNYLSFTFTSFFALARCRRPDLIFVESPPLFLSVPAWLFSRVWRRPFLFNVADMWPDVVVELGLMREGFVLRMARRLECWSYRKAAKVNAVTEGIRDVLIERKGVPADKITFLPNGVDTRMFAPGPPDRELERELGLEGKQVLLYAGTLGYVHGLDSALEAMDCIRGELPNVMLVLIGGGSEREKLQRLAETRGLDNVRFLDPRPLDYVARLFSIAYAGYASQRNIPLMEGARSSKLMPIMASGKPVIYSASGEGARMIQEAGSGVVVPPEDPVALAKAIRQLIADPERAAEYGRSGRVYAEANLSWSALLASWFDQMRADTAYVPPKS